MAASIGATEAVAALLGAGADINARDIVGMTPLMFAARGSETSHTATTKLLVSEGADHRARDDVSLLSFL